MDWASALLEQMPNPGAAVDPVVPADSMVLLRRAKSILAEGDIAGARLILEHLAERGQGDAAYELARTYDKGVLTALGARPDDRASLVRAGFATRQRKGRPASEDPR
jgi:hypothetical protein